MRFAVLANRDLFGNITHEALNSTLVARKGRTVKRRLPVSGKIRCQTWVHLRHGTVDGWH